MQLLLQLVGEATRDRFSRGVLSLGSVSLQIYGTPSTDELPNSMLPHIDTHGIVA